MQWNTHSRRRQQTEVSAQLEAPVILHSNVISPGTTEIETGTLTRKRRMKVHCHYTRSCVQVAGVGPGGKKLLILRFALRAL
jgi:hypothetical protein